MKNSTKLLIFVLIIGCHAKNKDDANDTADPRLNRILGFYEYQAPSGGTNQYILIDTLKGKYYGIYYRSEPKRGKGQEYFANSLTRIQFTGNKISFVLDDRKLFNSKPVSPGKRSGNIPLSPGVIVPSALKFNGTLLNKNLELQCISDNGKCPDSFLKFRKIPLPE